MTGGRWVSEPWRASLRRVAAGPTLGFLCLALAPFVTAAWWKLAFGDVGWFILDYAVVVAAAAFNASTWMAAILFGRTRQLRASWFFLLAVLGSLIAAAAVWPHWVHDFGIIFWTTLAALGFPSSLIFKLAASHRPLPHLLWGLERGIPAAAMIGVFASAYLQRVGAGRYPRRVPGVGVRRCVPCRDDRAIDIEGGLAHPHVTWRWAASPTSRLRLAPVRAVRGSRSLALPLARLGSSPRSDRSEPRGGGAIHQP
jgi:hypothetical protein